MKRFINMGSIPGFRDVVKNLQHQVRYDGLDEDGNPIYTDRKMPIIKVQATEKIHGTNAGFSYNNIDKEWVQSRKNIITIEKDNAGCALFMQSKKEYLIELIKNIAYKNDVNLDKKGIILYGEFAGGNIQRNSCVSGLGKMFFIFKYCKVYEIEPNEETENYWVETNIF